MKAKIKGKSNVKSLAEREEEKLKAAALDKTRDEVNTILEICKDFLGAGFIQRRRTIGLVFKRKIFYRIARDLTFASQELIGEIAAKRNHSTVHWNLNEDKFERDILSDRKWKSLYLRTRLTCENKLEKSSIHSVIGEMATLEQRKEVLEKLLGELREEADKLEEEARLKEETCLVA